MWCEHAHGDCICVSVRRPLSDMRCFSFIGRQPCRACVSAAVLVPDVLWRQFDEVRPRDACISLSKWHKPGLRSHVNGQTRLPQNQTDYVIRNTLKMALPKLFSFSRAGGKSEKSD